MGKSNESKRGEILVEVISHTCNGANKVYQPTFPFFNLGVNKVMWVSSFVIKISFHESIVHYQPLNTVQENPSFMDLKENLRACYIRCLKIQHVLHPNEAVGRHEMLHCIPNIILIQTCYIYIYICHNFFQIQSILYLFGHHWA